LTKQQNKTDYPGFTITHDNPGVRPRTFYHRNEEAIMDWVKHCKSEANNLSFDEKYTKGRKLGKGKFSTVF
jgi:hypothetical protein